MLYLKLITARTGPTPLAQLILIFPILLSVVWASGSNIQSWGTESNYTTRFVWARATQDQRYSKQQVDISHNVLF